MRKATRGDWAAHAPATNCMWLAYLADTLLARKRVALDAAAKRALRAFRCGLSLPRARSAPLPRSTGRATSRAMQLEGSQHPGSANVPEALVGSQAENACLWPPLPASVHAAHEQRAVYP